MAVDLATNWLGLETDLLGRLATVGGLAARGGAYEFDDFQRNGGDLPAAYVLYGGHGTGDTPGNRRTPRIVEQAWQIVLVVRPAPSAGGESLADAGALLSALMAAFEGWRPTGCLDELEDASTDEPVVIYADGLVQFVQTYRARLRLG